MSRSTSRLARPTDLLFYLGGAGCLFTLVYCSAVLLVTVIEGSGVPLWTVQGIGGALVAIIVGKFLLSIQRYGWGGWGEMVRRTKVAIHIRYLEFQNR